jgi:uncharacterized protein YdbL (DUF1318 family)
LTDFAREINMKPLRLFLLGTATACSIALGGCLQTHNDVVISQPKPLEVNVNLNGKLTLVVQDANSDMDFIASDSNHGTNDTKPAGPKTSVNKPVPTKALKTGPGQPSSYFVPAETPAFIIFADATATISQSDILNHLRADFAENRKLLAAHLVGEAHTGYMVARESMTRAQRAFMAHDNRWRKRLYELRAAQTNQPLATIGLIYFKIRLKFVPAGAWVQQYDNSIGQWVWVHWKK